MGCFFWGDDEWRECDDVHTLANVQIQMIIKRGKRNQNEEM